MALKRRTYTGPSPQYEPPGSHAATSRKAVEVRAEAWRVIAGGAASSADLGGSSKYSNENFEDRSGEGFRENSNWSRVTRS